MSEPWVPAVSDRVVLKPSENWLQPYRDMSKQGRGATVRVVCSRGGWREDIKIEFDVKRKGAIPRDMWVHATDISPLPALSKGSEDA